MSFMKFIGECHSKFITEKKKIKVLFLSKIAWSELLIHDGGEVMKDAMVIVI